MRTGNEPVTARSALRMRFWLTLWGLIWTAAGTVAFAAAGLTWWSLGCAVLLLVVAVDMAVIVQRTRQGESFQPGRDVGPYPPGHGPNPVLRQDRERVRDLERHRRRRRPHHHRMGHHTA
ncbi:DUF6343 family protein [Streptomyces sp. NPDC093085]|uniref:DUF6343 family protein n=1 Tax=Streptomyces sp. NPDC093085 TaxID=3155068 RepID=UPI0034436669